MSRSPAAFNPAVARKKPDAHAIGLEVVAEGVANEKQLTLLRTMGCDFAQGFIFSRPCSTEEMGALLEKKPRW